MAYPSDLPTVTVRHRIVGTDGTPARGGGRVTAVLTGRLWTGQGSVVPTQYTATVQEDGTYELDLPPVDHPDIVAGRGEAYLVTEPAATIDTRRPGRVATEQFHVAPVTEMVGQTVDVSDVLVNKPKPGGGVERVTITGPATDESLAGIIADPNSQTAASLSHTIGAQVGQQVVPAIGAALNDLEVAPYQPGADYLPGALATHAGRLWYALPYQGDTEVETRTNHVTDPRFTTGWWVASRGPVTYTDGVATLDIDRNVSLGQTLISQDVAAGRAAATSEGEEWMTAIDVTVPADQPAMTFRIGPQFGPDLPASFPGSAEYTVQPGQTLRVASGNPVPTPADRSTVGLTLRAGMTFTAGMRFHVTRPTLERGSTIGPYIDGDMPDTDTTTYAWAGTPHQSASVETTTTRPPRPAPGTDSQAWAAIRQDAAVRPIGTLDARPEPVTANTIPDWMDNTRIRTWTGGTTELRESLDDGQTWYPIQTWPGHIVASSIRQFGNGELMVSIRPADAALPAQIWVSDGYPTLGPDAAWEKKVQPDEWRGAIRFTGAWSVYTHDNIGLAMEYGPKEGSTGGPVGSGEFARYLYLTVDYGKTWTTVLDLADHVTDTKGIHGHGVAWDPYWDRIWVTFGDDQDGTLYSDDLGGTWHVAHFNPENTSDRQNVGILPMPDAILFGTDIAPNGIHRIDRAHGKHKGNYPIDVAYAINDSPVRNALCHGICWAGPGHPAYFAFGAETNPMASVIVATRDGYHFETIWEDEHVSPPGQGLRGVVGPTKRGLIHSRLQDTTNQPQSWMRVSGPAPGY